MGFRFLPLLPPFVCFIPGGRMRQKCTTAWWWLPLPILTLQHHSSVFCIVLPISTAWCRFQVRFQLRLMSSYLYLGFRFRISPSLAPWSNHYPQFSDFSILLIFRSRFWFQFYCPVFSVSYALEKKTTVLFCSARRTCFIFFPLSASRSLFSLDHLFLLIHIK